MVSFCCDGCNETLKKQKVAKHNCGSNSVSCIDCSVTFYGNDYVKHTSCISEAQKYEKSLYREKNKSKSAGNKRPTEQQHSPEGSIKKAKPNPTQNAKESIANITNSKPDISNETGECQDMGEKKSMKKQKKKLDTEKMEIDVKSTNVNLMTTDPESNEGKLDVDGTLKSIVMDILEQDCNQGLSLGHIRKMTKKRSRKVGIQLTDQLFYSCMNHMSANIRLSLINNKVN